ncbi:hypothetical protein ACI4CD_29390, partial [Klebsiella pneumoniae]|uniref:hypothetical protein n=1 Tax=Klebsiella pneumoniae TaxID=573 RepID=UPI003851B594
RGAVGGNRGVELDRIGTLARLQRQPGLHQPRCRTIAGPAVARQLGKSLVGKVAASALELVERDDELFAMFARHGGAVAVVPQPA